MMHNLAKIKCPLTEQHIVCQPCGAKAAGGHFLPDKGVRFNFFGDSF